MFNRERTQGKNSLLSSSTSGETRLKRSRPFFNPAELEEVSPQKKKLPDLQAQMERGARFRESLSRMKVYGNRPEIQPKLAIGVPGDKYELEADRMATAVVNQINAPVTQQSGQNLQREEMTEEDELHLKSETETIQREEIPEEELQMKPMLQLQSGEGGTAATSDLESSIQQARSSGKPLADNICKPMEQAFRADFSGVKVHTDAQSDQLNRSIQARAFTTGQDVFFRHGEYNPGSRGGQELLAHELTHVVQQNNGVIQRKPGQKAVSELDDTQLKDIYSQFDADKRKTELEKIVWAGHLQAISEVCTQYKYRIAIRETGPLSIKRIREGAKAKPHTILEKSIKESSLKKRYTGEGEAESILRKLKEWDLDGFVGHWNPNHELIGVRIDNPPEETRRKIQDIMMEEGGIAFIPLIMNSRKGGRFIESYKLRLREKWKKYLYTGDYDLHEVYSAGGGGGQIPEATPEKVKLLNRLNQGIVKKGEMSEMRHGQAELLGAGDKKRVHVEGEYAMFQHGDQATYRQNQHVESKALMSQVALLARAVATESPEPIAWCMMGKWFVTRNKYEHEVFRKVNKLIPPHTWSEIEDQRTKEGKKKTERYI